MLSHRRSSGFTDYGAAYNQYGGHVAYSASADTVLWSSSSSGVLVSRFTATFSQVPTLPTGSVIASDKLNNTVFYGAYGASFYVSTNLGVSFTKVQTLGTSATANKVAVNILTAGDVWISTDVGFYHSTGYGATLTTISGFTSAYVRISFACCSSWPSLIHSWAHRVSLSVLPRPPAATRLYTLVEPTWASLATSDPTTEASTSSRSTMPPTDSAPSAQT